MQHANEPVLSVAVTSSPALGDSLLLMTVARNLQLSGKRVTVFSGHMDALREWFPAMDIRPALNDDDADSLLRQFDTVIQLHADRPVPRLAQRHPAAIVLEHLCRAPSPEAMAARLTHFCRESLHLRHAQMDNGLSVPAGLIHRKHALRVAIHPTASTADKRWLAPRFLSLARQLKSRGFDPHFIVTDEERADWEHVQKYGIGLPRLGSLDNVAAWLVECGWFIGNDSGIGHLASCLQVPTLSLFMRKGIARTWRPGWGAGKVLVGGAWLPTGRLKERCWKYALSVSQVLRAFEQLRREAA
ncbi:glycosyltransferase family 9 protein [Paraburkholderia sp. Tr-20389]|uniref:glycosyltransferase family 9 protein n=1 Tax=Paraburkholderia sp. Tr-20389 TaxID=2703903 RepID=UPI00197D4712|nr:glycosyltransferase family 9 protein [Paraburkholderia sp. Tr-20389]MBN3755647.1 glycosyltransferase family 9 protein [Paraburkholderia sp. Tr-20389]